MIRVIRLRRSSLSFAALRTRTRPHCSYISHSHYSTSSSTANNTNSSSSTSPVHFINGEWITQNSSSSESNANVSAFDISFLRGYGAFDFLRTYKRKPFLLNEHVNRLLYTCSEMSIPFSAPKSSSSSTSSSYSSSIESNLQNKDFCNQIVLDGIKKNPSLKDLYIKLFITGGCPSDAISVGTSKPSFMALFLPSGDYPKQDTESGIKLKSFKHQRFLPYVKSTNYMAAVYSKREAEDKYGCHDAFYISPDGENILEGVTFNLFFVKGDKVMTPKENVLAGTTRDFILNSYKGFEGKKLKMEFPERIEYKRLEQGEFDECFITSTTRQITPVYELDGIKIGNGKVGQHTKHLMKWFDEYTAAL